MEETRHAQKQLDGDVCQAESGNCPSGNSGFLITLQMLIVYLILVVIIISVGLFKSLSLSRLGIKASQNLHDAMYTSLTRTSIAFFDNNTTGLSL